MTTTVDGTAGITFPDGTTQITAATSAFSSGTVLLFYQAAAPTGWTQVTTQNNKALRVVSGTGGVSGGSVAFTTAFASQSVAGTVGATTLSTTQIPSHTHNAFAGTAAGSFPFFGYSSGYNQNLSAATSSTGSGGSHDHTFSGTAINLAVQYIDVIIASKN
jgi:hypothetical protein